MMSAPIRPLDPSDDGTPVQGCTRLALEWDGAAFVEIAPDDDWPVVAMGRVGDDGIEMEDGAHERG